MEQDLKTKPLTVELLKEAKRMEFPDKVIAELTGKSEKEIHDMRYENGIVAAFKMVDTCAAEFEASTPYYYSVFGSENEAEETTPKKKVLVLGSGPIRIGQGIEFDYCSVHSTWAFAKEGWETVIVNNNPETVSTDFDIADKLYFEPLTPEDVEAIVNIRKTGRSCCSVRWTDRNQADRKFNEDGCQDSWNQGRRCRCCRGQRAL